MVEKAFFVPKGSSGNLRNAFFRQKSSFQGAEKAFFDDLGHPGSLRNVFCCETRPPVFCGRRFFAKERHFKGREGKNLTIWGMLVAWGTRFAAEQGSQTFACDALGA